MARNDSTRKPPRRREETRDDHGSTHLDDEAIDYWDDACAALPPMSPEAVAAVAVIVRAIDARRQRP